MLSYKTSTQRPKRHCRFKVSAKNGQCNRHYDTNHNSRRIGLLQLEYLILAHFHSIVCQAFVFCRRFLIIIEIFKKFCSLIQSDGTWTDIPRCIEHDPGVQEQIPGLCPGISGYCSEAFIGQRCNFDCSFGADIDSVCSQDGTWEPYPTCAGDLRETQDGCDGCPGPFGRARNRTAEAILGNIFL